MPEFEVTQMDGFWMNGHSLLAQPILAAVHAAQDALYATAMSLDGTLDTVIVKVAMRPPWLPPGPSLKCKIQISCDAVEDFVEPDGSIDHGQIGAAMGSLLADGLRQFLVDEKQDRGIV